MSDKRKRTVIWNVARWCGIALFVLFLLTIIVLKMVGSAKDPLRLGLQDYLTKTSGHPAEITVLNETALFPDIVFDMSDVIIRDRDDPGRTLARVEHVRISMSYWKRFLGVQDYNDVRFENMALATAYIFPQKLDVSFAGLSDRGQHPYFVVEGRYNNRDLLTTAQMRRKGKSAPHSYDFKAPYPVTFKLGATEMEGVMQSGLFTAGFENLFLSTGGIKAELKHFQKLSADPLRVGFSGEMENGFFEGLLSLQGHNINLHLFPKNSASEEPDILLESLETLAQGLRDDFGIDRNDDGAARWRIEVAPANITNTQSETEE